MKCGKARFIQPIQRDLMFAQIFKTSSRWCTVSSKLPLQ